jgi:hypothetical protein
MAADGARPLAAFDDTAARRHLAQLRAMVAELEARLGLHVGQEDPDRFIVTKIAAEMLGTSYANAKKLAQEHGELRHGRRGFPVSFIASFRESRGLPPLP